MYKNITINISRKEDDSNDKFFKIACDILKQLGGHERDYLWLYEDQEYPYMNHNYRKLEPVWCFIFYTKNIQNRHKKIFKKLQKIFPNRNIYCPNEEEGWRLFLTRLAECMFIIRDFIKDINFQRLNEEEKKIFKKIEKKV